ncbi:YdiK family protein [Bacillus cereus]
MQGFIGGFFCMRNSPLFMATLYFLLGCIFTRFAITNVTDTIWNVWTILFAVMATIDFNLALRLILVKFTKKKQ